MGLFFQLLEQMGFIATLIFIGFCAVRLGFLSSKDVDGLSKLLLKVILPFLVITVVTSAGTREEFFSAAPFILCILLMYAILGLVGFVSAKLLGYTPPKSNVHINSCMFVNSALLGYPIIMALFPEESGIAIAAFMLTETVVTWTAGILILTYGQDGSGIRLKNMVTPATIALVLALLLILADIKPSGLLWDTFTGIGNCNKYLGLIFIGADMGRRGFQNIAADKKVLFVSPCKLVIGPILVFLVLSATNLVSPTFVLIATLFSMLPSMMITTILAQQYDTAPDYATAALLSTTVFSLITIPAVFWVITEILM